LLDTSIVSINALRYSFSRIKHYGYAEQQECSYFIALML